jgi:16S rRNA (guanine1516-N2)-methyltransferase
MPARVVVLLQDSTDARREDARTIASGLGLRIVGPAEIGDDDLALLAGPEGLELRSGHRAHEPGVRVDLSVRRVTAKDRGRRGHTNAQQPLRRALGRRPRFVVDATAGFGDDAIALASWGHRVLAVERSPVMAALLADGLQRARAEPGLAEIAGRITLLCAEAKVALRDLDRPPDVVYVDPMYASARSRSALPRKKIQLLRRLVGSDADASDLIEHARAAGARRIVVKRALRAEPIFGSPSERHLGKLVRYDVYVDNRPAPGTDSTGR